MISMLFVLAAALAAVTVWYLGRALRTSAPVTDSRHALNQVRDRLLAQLAELERTRGAMDATAAVEEERRVSLELAQVLRELEAPAQRSSATSPAGGRDWRVVATLAVAIPVFAATSYFATNGPTARGLVRMALGQAPADTRVPPMVLDMIGRLEKKLAEEPGNVQGWMQLGRSYAVLERLMDARAAYAKAYALAPDSIEVLNDYAWAVFNSEPGNTTGLVAELYTKLQAREPNHPDALWFLGLASYQKGDPRGAVRYWRKLEQSLPPQTPALPELRRSIAQVEAELKGGRK